MKSLLGIRMRLLIGPKKAVPAPRWFLDALDTVTVTHRTGGVSGFQVTLRIGRSGARSLREFRLLDDALLEIYSRFIVEVTVRAMPHVLMDGVITHHQLGAGREPGSSTLTVSGVDVSALMGLGKPPVLHPGLDDAAIVRKLIARYAEYGIRPDVQPTRNSEARNPNDTVPVQRDTDLAYIESLGRKHDHVFYLRPGPSAGQSTAYWGPRLSKKPAQPYLSVNLGHETNVSSVDFDYDPERAVRVSGKGMDPRTGRKIPVQSFDATLPRRLAARSALDATRSLRGTASPAPTAGISIARARASAQAQTDASASQVLHARGEIDTLRYGAPLETHRLVSLRGVGASYNGLYYVKEVTHTVRTGEYRQRFTLAREGLGSTGTSR